MKLSKHKISKVLKEFDSKKSSAVAGEASGHQKLTCYAVKALNNNNIIASFENICAALWTMFPKVDRFHLSGFEDIPEIDYMEKCIKLRGVHTHHVLSGGNSKDKTISEPFYLTDKGALWAKEAEAILSGKIKSSAKEKIFEGTLDYHDKDLMKIINSELYKISKEEPDTDIEKPEIAYALGIYFIDTRFADDLKKKIKDIQKWLKQRKTDKKESELDGKINEFINWVSSKGVNII